MHQSFKSDGSVLKTYLSAQEKAAYNYQLYNINSSLYTTEKHLRIDGSKFQSILDNGTITIEGYNYLVNWVSSPSQVSKANSVLIITRTPPVGSAEFPRALVVASHQELI